MTNLYCDSENSININMSVVLNNNNSLNVYRSNPGSFCTVQLSCRLSYESAKFLCISVSTISKKIFILSLDKHMIQMLLPSFGIKPPKGLSSLRLIAYVRQLMMEFIFYRPSLTKLMVITYLLRWDSFVRERKNSSLQFKWWRKPFSCEQDIKWYC